MEDIIDLEEHARRVESGEAFVETLRSGEKVRFRVKPPAQKAAYEIQKVLQSIISANPDLLSAQQEGGQMRLTDAGVLMRFQELDGRCLVACVDSITEANVMHYVDQLPPDCVLLKRVKSLCGVEAYDLEEDSEGN